MQPGAAAGKLCRSSPIFARTTRTTRAPPTIKSPLRSAAREYPGDTLPRRRQLPTPRAPRATATERTAAASPLTHLTNLLEPPTHPWNGTPPQKQPSPRVTYHDHEHYHEYLERNYVHTHVHRRTLGGRNADAEVAERKGTGIGPAGRGRRRPARARVRQE